MLLEDLPQKIDSTMISCFRTCPQKFYNEFVLGLRPQSVSVDLHAGACFAAALERVYRAHYIENETMERAIELAYATFKTEWGNFVPPPETSKTQDNVWAAVEEYFKHFGLATDHVQPYFSEGLPTFEFTFALPLDDPRFPRHPNGEPYVYCGRFDALCRWGDKIIVRDEKTTSSLGSTWSRRWSLRSQFIGYVWACQHFGLNVDTVCVRGVGILKTRISFAEVFCTYPRHLIDMWYEQLRRDLERINAMWERRARSAWDYNLSDSCVRYGVCEFSDMCMSRTPESWASRFEVRRWDPTTRKKLDAVVPNAQEFAA